MFDHSDPHRSVDRDAYDDTTDTSGGLGTACLLGVASVLVVPVLVVLRVHDWLCARGRIS